jgi:hypothetical protein
MSITIEVHNGVRMVHLRGPAEDPLTEQVAQFINYALVREQRQKQSKRAAARG